MARRKLAEKERLRSFLKAVIPDAEKALKILYPTDRHALIEGQQRLHLLYIPQQGIDTKTLKPIGKPYPIPAREIYYEWEYLTGEVFKWDWKKVAELNGAEKFPPREPPFPVPKFHPRLFEGKRKVNKVYKFISVKKRLSQDILAPFY